MTLIGEHDVKSELVEVLFHGFMVIYNYPNPLMD